MEMKKRFVVGAGVAVFALALAAKDKVIMTVNGVDVPKSEFEYLYGKNSQQQLNQQPLEEYVEMFKLYKLKVADARAEGIDTTEAFRKEMAQYRNDLAAPYLVDSTYLHQLLEEMYVRSQEEVQPWHIMYFKKPDSKHNARSRQVLDSLRAELMNGADFADLARQYSEDKGSAPFGGKMPFITAGKYPYDFEVASYALGEGEISQIVESPVGYHLIRGGERRPARGKVLTAHILKMVGRDADSDAKAKAQADSIYEVLMSDPSKFADLATRFSDDRGSARQGGSLPWFGPGETVAEYDSVAFALPNGEISKPVRSQFGWHIIKKIDSKGVPGIEEIKPQFLAQVTSPQDARYELIKRQQTERFAKKHKAKINAKTRAAMESYVSARGLDSLFTEKFGKGAEGMAELFVIDGKSIPVSDFAAAMKKIEQDDAESARKILDTNLMSFFNGKLVEAEEARLMKEEPSYRNLLNEYVDGSLLYEVSVRKVWDKAAKDTDGLKEYFNTHRDNFKWSQPHAKGYLVQAKGDSIAEEVRQLAAETGRDSLVNTIRKRFQGNVSIDKVLVEKGTNPMVDYLMFGGQEVKPSKSNFTTFFMIDGRVLTEPEEFSDVRGLVTNEYQNELQSKWEDELKTKYPVKVNEKVLKSVKRN